MAKPNASGPFDDSVEMRQRRMGLLLPEGGINQKALETIASVYSGLLFDCLCDNSIGVEQVFQICNNLINLKDCGETRRIFLAICIQYDAAILPLPDPMWWIAGNDEMVAIYVRAFLQHLAELVDMTPRSEKES